MDELSKSVITSSLNPIMAWVIPFVFGGLIFVVNSPFSKKEKAKNEYIRIITAYIAAGRIPSKNDLISLKHMLARKHGTSANDLPAMEIVLDYSYCTYWAAESIDIDQKNSFNTHFLSSSVSFLENDSVIPKTLKDRCRKGAFEIFLNLIFAAILTFISFIFIIALDPTSTPFPTFFPNTLVFLGYSYLGQLILFLLQELFKLIVYICIIIKNRFHSS